MRKPKGIYILGPHVFETIYGADAQAEIASLIDIDSKCYSADEIRGDLARLADVEIVLAGWHTIPFEDPIVRAASKLKAILYGSGSIRGVIFPAVWECGIVVSSAWTANAVPVAEYTLSQILFSLKRGWYYALETKRGGQYPSRIPIAGAYGTTVGLISLGAIGRHVRDLLRPFDVKVLAYEPFISSDEAAKFGIELVTLDAIFERSDVVSLHAPNLPQTEGLITGSHFSRMREHATFINTARGIIVRENEMIDVLKSRPDLYAILDVTWPEPPVAGSPLYLLPNVILTPHIAGSTDGECRRMGDYMVDELKRFLNGEPLKHQITREMAERLA